MLTRVITGILVLGCLVLPADGLAQSEPLQAAAAVQGQRVYVGQQFLLQIQIQGTDQPDPLDMRPLERDFDVTEAGGGASNSTSVSIVNGRMTRQVRRGYNYNYRLAARQPGEAVIPSLTVTSDGRSAKTQPVRVQVLPPQENDDFKLRLSLSEQRAYLGQPLRLTVTWYIRREVREFTFTMPLLDDERFEVLEPPGNPTPTQGQDDLMEIRLGDRRAVARRGTDDLGGITYTVLRFEKLLVPRVTGSLTVPEATVTFVTPGRQRSARRGLFDDFFGGSGFPSLFDTRQMETLSIPSNRPTLDVLALPQEGRPARFNGWIGQFQLSAAATPTSVAVGEPITLALTVTGSRTLPSARFPDLDQQPDLAAAFNVPKEIGAGSSEGGNLVFTQTLRARSDRVTQVPAVELPYFDPSQGEYRIARSEPIGLAVEPSRIVTAEDAEGAGPMEPRQLDVESSDIGIAHSYVDPSALRPSPTGWAKALGPLGPLPLALAFLLLPPLLFCAVLVARSGVALRSPSDWLVATHRRKWKRAIGRLDVEGDSGEAVARSVLEGLRQYLGARLGAGPATGALTCGDVERRLGLLARQGRQGLARPETLDLLRSVFERCEAGAYAGIEPLDSAGRRRLVDDADSVVDLLEEAWR